MEEKTYTQREFSNITGLSTATIVKMLKNGDLKRADNGEILESEASRIIISKLKDARVKGTLILCFDDSPVTKEQLIAYAVDDIQKTTKSSTTPMKLDSIDDIILKARDIQSGLLPDTMVRLYNIKVLKTFMLSYDSIIKSKLGSLYGQVLGTDDKEKDKRLETELKYRELREKLPYEVLLDLFYYKKVIYTNSSLDKEIIEPLLASLSDVIEEIQGELDKDFSALMKKLFLVSFEKVNQSVDDCNLLFTRDDLTPSFFECSGKLYNSFLSNKNIGGRPVALKQVPKIAAELKESLDNKRIKSNTKSLLESGYYTIVDIKDSTAGVYHSSEEALIISKLYNGLYSKILINLPQSKFEACISAGLQLFIKQAISMTNMKVEYISI